MIKASFFDSSHLEGFSLKNSQSNVCTYLRYDICYDNVIHFSTLSTGLIEDMCHSKTPFTSSTCPITLIDGSIHTYLWSPPRLINREICIKAEVFSSLQNDETIDNMYCTCFLHPNGKWLSLCRWHYQCWASSYDFNSPKCKSPSVLITRRCTV